MPLLMQILELLLDIEWFYANFLLFYKDISLNAYFHYYATYLAACLAGMPLKRAQLLAYYCQTMSTMYQGSSSVEEWDKFYPKNGKFL